MSKLNHLFFIFAALSFCLRSAIGGTLKPNSSICPEYHPDDIQSEIRYTSVFNFLLEGSDATSLESLTDLKLFRSLHFYPQRWENVETILSVLQLLSLPESGAIRASVHEITISGLNSTFSDAILPQLENLIPQLKNLSILRWESNLQIITPSTLRAIESLSPPAKLYYSLSPNAQGYSNEDDAHFEQAHLEQAKLIPSSASLHSLKAHDEYGDCPKEKTLRHVFNALVSNSNINELDLSFAKENQIGGPNAFDFASRVGERFPPLRVLRLNRYNFDATSEGSWAEAFRKSLFQGNDGTDDGHANELRRRDYPQEPLLPKKTTKKSNMEWWLEAMDWSQIRTLDMKLSSFKNLKLLHAAVPNLSKLSLQGRRVEDTAAIVDFVANLTFPLESLALLELRLSNLDNVLDVITSEKHATSLKHLSLTARNDLDSSVVIRLNTSTIRHLLRWLPHLETLTLSIPSNEPMWNYPRLLALSSHHGIRHLTLHVDISDREARGVICPSMSSSSVIQPLINATSTPGLFRYLRKHKSGVPLDTLTVSVNERQYFGYKGQPRIPSFNQKDDDSDRYYMTNTIYSCSLNHVGLEVCKHSIGWFSSSSEDLYY